VDFWAKTTGLQHSLVAPDKSSLWYCSFRFADEGVDVCVQIRRALKHKTSTTPPTIMELKVGMLGTWKPCLRRVAATFDALPMKVEYTQHDWWKSNGRAFRLFDLPLELRMCIYGQVTGPYVWPNVENTPSLYYRWDGSTHWMGGGPRRELIQYFDPTKRNICGWLWRSIVGTSKFHFDPCGNWPPPQIVLIRACKQVEHEFRSYAHVHTTKHFREYHTLCYVIQHTPASHLRRISLGFPNKVFFALLGFADTAHGSFARQPNIPILVLTGIATLHAVSFHFQLATMINNPLHNRPNEVDPFSGVGRDTRVLSCQKTIIDWFLTLAFEHVRHIPCPSISGHIKNSVHSKWEAIFQDGRKGVVHDMSVQAQMITSTPLHLV
jgi:hypothetical protein